MDYIWVTTGKEGYIQLVSGATEEAEHAKSVGDGVRVMGINGCVVPVVATRAVKTATAAQLCGFYALRVCCTSRASAYGWGVTGALIWLK